MNHECLVGFSVPTDITLDFMFTLSFNLIIGKNNFQILPQGILRKFSFDIAINKSIHTVHKLGPW